MQISLLYTHTLTHRRVNAKKQQQVSFNLQAFISKLRRNTKTLITTIHTASYYLVRTTKSLGVSWGWTTPLNETTHHITQMLTVLPKKVRRLTTCNSVNVKVSKAWCLAVTVELPSFIRIGQYRLHSVPWMSVIWSFKLSQAQFPFPMMQSADEFMSCLQKLKNSCLGKPVLLITTGRN